MTQPEPQPEAPKFDPNASHQQKPRLRPVRGFAAQAGDQPVLGLADARQISEKVIFTHPAVQNLLPLMDGSRDLDAIIAEVGPGLTRDSLETLVAQLDGAALLEGPVFEALWSKVKTDFDNSTILPPASTAALAENLAAQELGQESSPEQRAEKAPGALRAAIDQWIDKSLENADDPSFDTLPKAIVAPHIDYQRGWINYGAVWGRLRVVDRPDRVVILGTNHFGQAPGVCACDKGYESPFGVCEPDTELIESLRGKLGESLYEHRYDHEQEHSIELQIPWIQHCLGADEAGNYPRVFGALVHDPAVNNGEGYDGKGVGLNEFVKAMKEVLGELGGTTLIVSSADLSHVGPAFGDPQPLAGDAPEVEQARNQVLTHDREMLDLFRAGKAEDLVSSMAWQQNPTRWCSVGNMVAAFQIAQPGEVRILNYSAAMDQQGMGMVSSAAAAMF